MRQLLNLKGVERLNRNQLKTIHGGAVGKCGGCTGKPVGAICSNSSCTCFGVCSNGSGGPCDMF